VAAGAVHLSFHDALARRLRKGGAIALVTVGLFALTNFVLTPKVQLQWLHSESEAVAAARSSGRPLLVDFGAGWCLPCKELDAKVFGEPEVAQLMSERFTLLRIDCDREDEDPAIAAVRERYQAASLPAVRVVAPGGDILARLDSADITPAGFVKLLAKAVHCGPDAADNRPALVDCRPFPKY
jgi:thiol:disulfide interchange protein